MILDAIIAFIAALVEPVVFGMAFIFVPFLNLLIQFLELVISMFVSGFKIKRIEKRSWEERKRLKSTASTCGSFTVLGIVVLAIVVVDILDREVQFVATDGHSLPFAEVVITTENGTRNERTDKTGNLEIPRFGALELSMVDPRYIKKSWTREEIDRRLVVERTVLGSTLDKFANTLLKKDE